MRIDLLAILQKSLDRAIFCLISYPRFDRVALEPRSQLCTSETSTNCNEISFDPHSFSGNHELRKRLLPLGPFYKSCRAAPNQNNLSSTEV